MSRRRKKNKHTNKQSAATTAQQHHQHHHQVEGELFGAGFDAEAYARRLFERDKATAVRDVHATLGRKRDDAARKLKDDVFKNYQRFLTSSREIASLESDLERARDLFLAVSATLDRLQDAALDLPLDTAPSQQQQQSQASAATTAMEDEVVKEIDWLCGVPEEVTLALAQRRFADASKLLGQVAAVRHKRPVLAAALRGTELGNELAAAHRALADALTADVVALHLSTGMLLLAPQAREAVELLAQLGLSERAKAAFLQSRSSVLRRDAARVRFEGDILRYVGELSRTCIAGVAAAIKDFTTAFPNGQDVSRLTHWASVELLRFADTFRKRVFYSEDFSVVGEALHITLFHCSVLLPAGFDLSFVLSHFVSPHSLSFVCFSCSLT